MSTKHTPIPWEIRERTVDGEVVQCDIYHGEMRIGSVTIRPDRPWSANARLIAAAPDLLEAGQGVLDAWGSGDLAAAVRELSAAIAKARGEVAA